MSTSASRSHTDTVKAAAKELGFSFCGISKARFLEEEAPRLEEWLKRNYHGKMFYLANHFDKRLDPTLLVPGAKSVISLVYNYYPKEEVSNSSLKVARYAYGEDYHDVVRAKLKDLFQRMKDNIGDIAGRVFVDSAPVMERSWAQQGGLGWIGKNSLLLNRQMGSYFFLAEIITDLELEYDTPVDDYCGTCTACIDACPTDAITEPYVVDGSKCISYYTIELKEAIPVKDSASFNNWIFGCDICQEVCPWNRFARPNEEKKFLPSEELKSLTREDWIEMTEETFGKVFGKSPLMRRGHEGLMRNVRFVTKNEQNDTSH